MGKKDTKAKEYMSDNNRFADLCNFALFDGQNFIFPDDLVEKDSTEVLSILGINEKEISHQQKWRDLLKSAIIKTTDKAVFVLIGIENQTDIHYAMPVKCMIYDALNYGTQVKEANKKHRKDKDFNSNEEFLSGFKKTDKLTPVIPITLYFGTDKWDAPTSLYEMFDNLDEKLKPFIPDYKITLISPEGLENDDLNKFKTDLKEFFGAIKYSNNKKEFNSFITENPKFKQLANETVEAINIFTGTKISINKKGGSTNMCKAIEELKKESASREIVNAVESAMKNFKISLEAACAGLNYTLEKYNEAKQELQK